MKGERTIESFFEDVPEKEGLKTIYKKEAEYAGVLGSIEHIIAQYYLMHPKITDDDIANALKNFRQNYDKKFEDESIEYAIQIAAHEGLKKFTKKKKISRHEFFLVIDYILWSISNRDWLPDERAYLKWICNFFGLLNGEEKETYDESYKLFGHVFNLPKEQISLLKDKPSEMNKEGIEMLDKMGIDILCPCGSGKKYKKCCGKIA